jgi:O-antigen/teichoic acid export membrane protein
MIGLVGKGSFWVLVRQLIVRLISVVQVLTIANLLTPGEVGLFSICMMVFILIDSFTAIGLGQALLRKTEINDLDIDTLFVTNIIRGVLIFILVGLLSYPVSIIMDEPSSRSLILLMGFYPLIQGFNNPSILVLQRTLNFKKEIPFYLGGVVSNFIITLAFAMKGLGAKSLVYGLIGQGVVQLVISYIISPYGPRLRYSKESFSELFLFGKWILYSQGLKYFSTNLPSWIIGSLVGSSALGIYNLASRTSQSIGNEFTSLVSTIAFPSFAIIQNDIARLSAAYIRSQKIILSSSFLLFALMFSLSTPFTMIFLNKDWSGVAPLIKMFSLIGLVYSIGAQTEVLKALNLPNVIVKYNLIRLILVLITIYYLTVNLGTVGALVSILFSSILSSIMVMRIILFNLRITFTEYLKLLAAPAIAFFCVLSLQYIFEITLDFGLGLFILSALCLTVLYTFILFFFDNIFKTSFFYQWRELLIATFKKTNK